MPTPRPIIVASVGATVPISVTAATSEMIDRRSPRPNSEVRSAAHRNDRAERDEQDDHREEEPDDVRRCRPRRALR